MRFYDRMKAQGKRLGSFVLCRMFGYIVLAIGVGILVAIAIPPWLILWIVSLFLIFLGLLLIF